MNGTGAILRLSITPLPQRGRGAGGEGGPQRGRGAGGEGDPSPGSPFIHGAKVCWTPSRNDCTGTGHAQ